MFGSGGHHDAVPTPASKKHPKAARPSAPSSTQRLPSDPLSMEQLSSAAISEFLAPAVDGPPSPQRLRQLTRQMKRASYLQRHHGHKTASSESSSLSSLAASDRVPVDLTMDSLSFARRSSTRSIDSSTTSRDRPESIHNFGRAFFHRRGKSNRESSAHRPTDSVYSDDVNGDPSAAAGGGGGGGGGKESILPSMFFRRKPSSGEAAPKRPQISLPFNFQHVAHKPLDKSRNQSSPRALSKAHTGVSTLERCATSHHLPRSLSQGSLDAIHTGQVTEDRARTPLIPIPRHTSVSFSGPRRLLKQIRSEDQLRKSRSPSAPPRPPRSPTQLPSALLPPTVPPPLPPRTSSRQSSVSTTIDSVVHMHSSTSGSHGRQQAPYSPFSPTFPPDRFSEESGRQQAPYSPHSPYSPTFLPERLIEEHGRQPAPHSPFSPIFPRERWTEEFGSSGSSHLAQMEQQYSPTDAGFSSVMVGARDSTWPLPSSTPLSSDSALPDVPEEEEHHGLSRLSGLSIASNTSSLRGIQSVPTLRRLAKSQRSTSGVSDTLVPLDVLGLPRAIGTKAPTSSSLRTPARESWEDVVDYCYEHEAEANCDYQWDRPSLDMSRDGITDSGTASTDMRYGLGSNSNTVSPTSQASFFPTTSQVPSLSPASNTSSTQFESEAITPNFVSLSQFAPPHADGKHSISSSSAKASSDYPTFSKSQPGNLSPALLIPCDYQQEMLQHHPDKQAYNDYEFLVGQCHASMAYHDDASLSLGGPNRSFSLADQRISTSTTGTGSTSRSNSIGRPYRSCNSSRTTLTRRTASSSSLSRMAGTWAEESESLSASQSHFQPQCADGSAEEHNNPVAQDFVPDMVSFLPSGGFRKSHHRSHASESRVCHDSVVGAVEGEGEGDGAEKAPRVRARAQTAAAAAAPPVGQYVLFPRGQVKMTGERI
ncbi:uncharacterized protein CPUR_08400 [Claviceps purpurea 20.1]|uniref:CRIB domain-containing protein n=1 Tax=Claviceps purpurea (strain 20.1) TaxID=1111077 RepID=M1WGE6_CLAP2|nr:uncharacterized protein CPUR_08400 [Claviceps purpurea 20.1]